MHFDIVVIGGGPTGIAALFQAKANKLNAIALEAGNGPLNSISQYPDGLILSSPADHFQIAGIPLDCKNPYEVTKEEVIYYYARIINAYDLEIRSGSKLTKLTKEKGALRVFYQTAQGRKSILTKKIIFTAWYKPKNLDEKKASKFNIQVVNHLTDPIQLAGKRIIVRGGGISAIEISIFLMMNGHKIYLLLRGKKNRLHTNQKISDLLNLTRSEIVEDCNDIKFKEREVNVIKDGKPQGIKCDTLINCIGQEINKDGIQILKRFGAINDKLYNKLLYSESADKILRNFNTGISEELLNRIASGWPDLYNYFVKGVKGVHFAGGVLHIGSSSAGILTSIFTGITAVDIIAKKKLRYKVKTPLPLYLKNRILKEHIKLEWNHVRDLRPLPVRSWTRNALPVSGVENNFGITQENALEDYYLGKPKNALAKSILKLSDGKNSIEEIIKERSNTTEDLQKALTEVLYLFYHNGLTWLLPRKK